MVRASVLSILVCICFNTTAMAQEKITRLDGEVVTVPPASLFQNAESDCKRITDTEEAGICSRAIKIRQRRWSEFVRLHKAGKRTDAQNVHHALVRTKRDFVEVWPNIKIE